MQDSIVYKIAEEVNKHGGKTYYVGGFVRDLIQNKENKDIDIEVHGINEDKLIEILSMFCKPLSYGKSFGIYSLAGTNIDIALPRIEKRIGKGHKDFEVEVNPNIDLIDCISRRDFTINAIYKDVLTDEIIDPYNGVKDIKNKLIKHINASTFIEDPLRVLRGAQFASRFNYEIDKNTIELCKQIDITTLSCNRVEEELKKALLKSDKPSIFFRYLALMNKLDDWFKDVNIKYVDEAKKYINNVNNKYGYLLSSLCIDCDFDITRITNEKEIIEYTNSMKKNINKSFNSDYDIYKTFSILKDINDYIYLRMTINYDNSYLLDKYKSYKELMKKESLTGKDLIKMGYKPGVKYSEILNKANDLRLRGLSKQEIIDELLKKN